MCLKVTEHTLQVLEQLQGAASECGTRRQCTTMTYLYPGVVWGEKQVKRHKCEIENADFFATELGITKGRFTYENPESVEVYEGTVYGTPYQTDGVDDLTYGVGATQQKVQVPLQLVNESALNTLMEGDDELTMVKDWERCQVELGPSGAMSPRAVERELWEPGTQVRVFYGTAEEESSQSEWLHRRPRMWNVQDLQMLPQQRA